MANIKQKRIFKAGWYYVADCNNNVIPFKNIQAARNNAFGDDVILVAIPSDPEDLFQHPEEDVTYADSIVFDFDKKLLTIEGGSVTLDKVMYDVGVTELEKEDLNNWYNMLSDAYKVAEKVTVIGNPPVDGKDITDEMSNL